MAKQTRLQSRTRRHSRVREKVRGSAGRPRLAVFRSITHIYAQLIDDDSGKTLVAASSVDAKDGKGSKSERAKTVGAMLGEKATAAAMWARAWVRPTRSRAPSTRAARTRRST